jgi:hypothetical protein
MVDPEEDARAPAGELEPVSPRPELDPELEEGWRALATLGKSAAIAESLGLGFHLGSAVERICVAADQGREGVTTLREAIWLIERYIRLVEQQPIGADLHAARRALGEAGETLAGLKAIVAALEQETEDAQPGLPAPAAEASVAPSAATEEPPASGGQQGSFGAELLKMAVFAVVAVVCVIAIVFALTLIGEWR